MLPVILATNDITPNSIGGLQLWLDATSIEQADATAVTSWRDKVSGSNAVSMSTTASQPIVKNNILNGKPVVRFDGVDDYLDLTYPFDYKIYGQTNGCAWSPDGTYFATGHSTTSPYIAIYKRSGNTFTKLSNPATLPTGAGQRLKFSPDGNYLAVPHSSSPFVTVYKRSGDTFTKIANPATLPVGAGVSVAWTSDSQTLMVASSAGTGNRLAVYSLNQSTDVLTLQSTGLSTSNVLSDISLSANDANLCMTFSNASPYMELATYNKSTYAITSLGITQPDVIPTGAAQGCAFSPDSNYLSISHVTSPYVSVYYRSGTTYTKLSDPATLPAGNGVQCAWSFDNQYLAVTHSTSPFVSIYQKSGTGASATLTKVSNPTTSPQNTGYGVSFSPTGGYLAVGNSTSGYLTMYTQSGSTFTALTELDMLRNVSGGSVFVVRKCNSYATTTLNFSITTSSSGAIRLYSAQLSTSKVRTSAKRLDADATANLDSTTSTFSDFDILGHVVDYANSNAYFYLNGLLDASSTTFLTDGNTSDTNSAVVTVGAFTNSSYLNGDIAEIIIYNKALTATEISAINKYLGAKWGITVA